MFDKFSEEHLRQITNDKELRDDVAKMLGFLNKFAVGIKYEVFNIDDSQLKFKLFLIFFHSVNLSDINCHSDKESTICQAIVCASISITLYLPL